MGTADRYASVVTRTELQFPIESVPIGARVPTKNPNRFEVDPQPEPDQATWAKLSITVERSDGGIVDAEIIRPRSWILRNGICAGRMLPFNLPELEVSGLALVTAIDDCPPIADGGGSVVTARFVTREVHVVASVDVLGADGTVETITGTTIHPVWSVDRQEWVPLAELVDGERLQGLDGLAVVLSVTLSPVSQPVYNIEVHGEHVYQVGELGLVVHNACFTNGLLFEKVFETSQGKVGFLAETLVNGKILHLKDIVIEPVKTGFLKVGIKEVSALKDQLIAESRVAGFDTLILTGERLTGANPGKIVEIIIDITK